MSPFLPLFLFVSLISCALGLHLTKEQLSAFVSLQEGSLVWNCCRACPHRHLADIDQQFGLTPPPVRKHDAVFTPPVTFLEMLTKTSIYQHDASAVGNCCSTCPPFFDNPDVTADINGLVPAPRRVTRSKAKALEAAVKFSAARPPLPPCCGFCSEGFMTEQFNDVVKPGKMAAPPAALLESDSEAEASSEGEGEGEGEAETAAEGEAAAETETETEAEAESDSAADADASSESEATANIGVGTCCSRCARQPTGKEQRIAAGENLWPKPLTPPTFEQVGTPAPQQ